MSVTTQPIEMVDAGGRDRDPFATVVTVRAIRAGLWEVVLGFGGDVANALYCGRFPSEGAARAAAPRVAQRLTSPERVAARRHRAACVWRQSTDERHDPDCCPLASRPLWRWQTADTPAITSAVARSAQPLGRAA